MTLETIMDMKVLCVGVFHAMRADKFELFGWGIMPFLGDIIGVSVLV